MENHIWFNKQSPTLQAELNKKFQEYKKCKIELVDESIDNISNNILILATNFIPQDKYKTKSKIEAYNRAKEKSITQKQINIVLSNYEKGVTNEYEHDFNY